MKNSNHISQISSSEQSLMWLKIDGYESKKHTRSVDANTNIFKLYGPATSFKSVFKTTLLSFIF